MVWQRAHRFVLEIYGLTSTFPLEERYGLTSQLRRAAASVPANIVEGFRRSTVRERVRFYNIAQASADECVYHLILAHDLGFSDTLKLQQELDELSRMLYNYIEGHFRENR
ncbi:MAG: four helix bundle protein [Opitutaceae bacterium]|nr:four helix bundle protein [Opitutaceae bacterium]